MSALATPVRSGYTALCSRFLFPLHELAKGHRSVPRLRELEHSQWWSTDRLESFRIVRLRDFLARIERTVPYYGQLFADSGFVPARLRSIADLERIPLLSKAEIRANTESLKAGEGEGLRRYNTGGSSGEPLVFFIGCDRVSHDVAAKWRATRWWGVDIGDPELVVWGSPIELGAQDWIRTVRDKVLRTSLFPAFELTEAGTEEFIRQVRKRQPAMLFGYPSVISRIAKQLIDSDRTLCDSGIKVAFVTSERLYPEQREAITQAFGCPVANGYGGRDAGFIAHECPHGGMHISAEDIIVEIVDAAGRSLPEGTAGEIVVTHMATGDFPFVRYRTGDVGVLNQGSCNCGRGLPMLKEVQGRVTDFVRAKDGTVMHGLALIYVVRELPGIQKFKIVQESVDYTRVMVVPDTGFDDGVSSRIRDGMRKRLGADVRIDVETVAEIPPEASGKYRYIVSEVVE
jgi:phenylacetate-CoA ligase